MTKMKEAVSNGSKASILAAVCLASLALPLSFSAGAVATPAIGRDLAGSSATLSWVTNGFMLTFGCSLMAAGGLADQFGRKRLFTVGMSAFAVVSLVLSFSPSVLTLDVLRALQGFAAAAALSGGSAALAQEFDGEGRTKAFSLLGTTFGIGLAFGPLLAGLLIETFGWRSVFMSGAVIGTLALFFGVRRMRESRDPNATGLDWAGTITFTGMLALFTFGVIQAPTDGWQSPLVEGLLLGAFLMLAAFVLAEARVARPMLDLSLFRYPRFVGVQMLPIATCYCYVVLLIILPLRFIGIEGRSEIEAGLLMTALSAPMLIVPLLAAMLTRWCSAGTLSGLGLFIAALGLFWLSRIDLSRGGTGTVWPMLVIGSGTGLPWGLMDGLSVSVVPKERAGMATGIFSTMRVAGEGVALAVTSAILASLIQAKLKTLAPLTSNQISIAAQRLATGDLNTASHALPGLARDILVKSYATAFQTLSVFLIVITLIAAIAAFGCLRSGTAVR